MMVALRLEPCTMRAGTNITRPDDRTIDEGRASKCEQKSGYQFWVRLNSQHSETLLFSFAQYLLKHILILVNTTCIFFWFSDRCL